MSASFCWRTGRIAVSGSGLVSLVSPCGALVRDVHEAHVAVLGGAGVVVAVVPEAGQTGLIHAGLLPQQGASGGGGDSCGGARRSVVRTWRRKQLRETDVLES